MRPPVAAVHELVHGIGPFDELEAAHREDALRWLESTDDVFRRVKPATPPRHLVSYVPVLDEAGSSMLVNHVNAGLWLPPGGHVEPDEHHADTAAREAREELGVEAVFRGGQVRPSFVTVTRTVGIDAGHVDVSLWFVLAGTRDMAVAVDRAEFSEARWWTHDQVLDAGEHRLDPHYQRFITKVAGRGNPGDACAGSG
jgi:8-oxo-dGTP diphosphatase